MTHFLRNILRQPKELQRTIEFFLASGAGALEAAKNSILSARDVYLTGIDSSWHAALNCQPAILRAIERIEPAFADWQTQIETTPLRGHQLSF